MKKAFSILAVILMFISCKNDGKTELILPSSVGKPNHILVVMGSQLWLGKVGDEVRTIFGEHQVGLPQPETLFSVSQVDPSGFKSFMRNNKAVLLFQKGDTENISVIKNKYAIPQIIITATAKDEADFVNLMNTRGKEVMKIFQDEDIKFVQNMFKKERINETKFKTIQGLGVELDIPKGYRLVDDTGDFLWLRKHLKSGVSGSNNILMYSVPLGDENEIVDNITKVRDVIGEKYIPGSKEGMYMITERAYTPFTYEATINGKKAYETRGKWEVKNDFMAGPFLNYTIIDRENNRLVIFEGFTYAPASNKRDFIFELEAIAKSLNFK